MVSHRLSWCYSPFCTVDHRRFITRPAALGWALLNGVFNGLGAWTLMAAMGAGGKASLVMPITAMYPLLVVLVAPVVFHESITGLQEVGVACAMISVVLISSDASHGH